MQAGQLIEEIDVVTHLTEITDLNGDCINHDEVIDLIASQFALNLQVPLFQHDFDYRYRNIAIGKLMILIFHVQMTPPIVKKLEHGIYWVI